MKDMEIFKNDIASFIKENGMERLAHVISDAIDGQSESFADREFAHRCLADTLTEIGDDKETFIKPS